jgi:gas vesicle protein
VSPGYPNIPLKQGLDLRSYLMMLVDDFKKGIKNSLKEIQENTAKQVEALKNDHKNPSKNYRKTVLNK